MFPRFDERQGTLQKVEYWARLTLTQALLTANNTSTSQPCDISLDPYLLTGQFYDPLAPFPPDGAPGMFPQGGERFEAIIPSQTKLAAGEIRTFDLLMILEPPGTPTRDSALFCQLGSTPAFKDLAGACDVRFTPQFLASNGVATGCPNVVVTVQTRTRVEVFVTYWFCRTPPIAVPDQDSICEGQGQTVTIDVLANDTLGDGTPVNSSNIDCSSLTIVQQGTRGVATIVPCPAGRHPCPSRCIRYTLNTNRPPGNTPVVDTFFYTFRDSFECTSNRGCVEIVIHPNPVAMDHPNVQTCQGTAVDVKLLCGTMLASGASLPSVCFGTTVVEPATIDCTNVILLDPPPERGMVEFVNCTGTCPDGSAVPCVGKCARFTPNAAFLGLTSFEFIVVDSFGCRDRGTVTVNVTPGPTALPDVGCICHGSSGGILIDVLSNDTAAPGRSIDRCSLRIENPPIHGSVELEGCVGPPCANCKIRYTPPATFVGTGRMFTDPFTYTVDDNNGCRATGNVDVTVYLTPTAVDDAAAVDTSAPDYPPIEIRLFDNDVPFPLPPSIIATIIEFPDPTQGTIVDFDPVTGIVIYDPFPTFTGPVQFRYRLCNPAPSDCAAPCGTGTTPQCQGCCDEATVTINLVPPCPTLNRSNPGSLLIFPIIDSRQGNVTMVTVTNTNCDFTQVPGGFAGTVDVKFYYVNKYSSTGADLGCLTTNRTRRLSPCDTLTLWTSADNTSASLGYLYVYAQSTTTGQPIVFNHLIGQEIVLYSIDGEQDAVNAIVYRGIGNPNGGEPLPDGTPTNLDGDNHRDLDGREYDVSPNRILIPRFLGQDPPGDMFRSRLALLALTGGTGFTTTLDFLIYNDNEVVQSANFAFRCWDLRYLTEISGAFDNAFLKSIGDDPTEIFGAPDRESGWMRIDGDVAFSTILELDDPAFWAVLIEAVPPYPVVDLPWEECVPGQAVQDNGDLLPVGPLGDT